MTTPRSNTGKKKKKFPVWLRLPNVSCKFCTLTSPSVPTVHVHSMNPYSHAAKAFSTSIINSVPRHRELCAKPFE